MSRAIRLGLALTLFSLAACGDDDGGDDVADARRNDAPSGGPDAPSGPDAPDTPDVDAAPTIDGSPVTTDATAVTAGDTCAAGTDLTTADVTSSTTGLSNDYTGTCAGDGPDGVFAIDVPAGHILTASVTSPFDAELTFVTPAAACMATLDICAAHVDARVGDTTETLRYRNTTAVQETVSVIVDGYAADDVGDFTLTSRVDAAPGGEGCENAVTLATLSGESTANYLNDYEFDGATCAPYTGEGPDKVYAVTIPAGQTLTVTALATTADFDHQLNLIAGPAAMCTTAVDCLAGADATTAATETFTYQNTTGAAQDAFLIVDGYAPDDAGGYDLTVTLL